MYYMDYARPCPAGPRTAEVTHGSNCEFDADGPDRLAVGLTLAPTARAEGVVGDGTPVFCADALAVDAAVNAALVGGGAVTFNCGGPATIALKSTKIIALNTTIDGGGVITLTKKLAAREFPSSYFSSRPAQRWR